MYLYRKIHKKQNNYGMYSTAKWFKYQTGISECNA